MTGRFDFARRPRWIASHVFALVMIATFIGLGFWQLQRLDERRDLNEAITSRSELAAVDVRELRDEDPGDAEYRRVTATGTWLLDDQVRVTNQSLDGLPGDWVVIPLELDDGTVVAVNRGFVPRSRVAEVDAYAPAASTARVEGLLFESVGGGRFATGDDVERAGPAISRLDLDAIGERQGLDLGALYVQADAESPAPDDLIQPVPPPDLGEGPHFSYAIQWFLFAAMTAVAYALILGRVARGSEARGDVAVPWDL